MTHLNSYWKTIAICSVIAALSLMAVAALLSSHWPRPLIAFAGSAISVVLIAGALVTAGGLVCLWRDARDVAGKADFFASRANAIPTEGILTRFGLRFLLGAAPRPGDVVQVRTKEEIAATLDADGAHGGLPYMAEMDSYTGKTFRVHRRIDKINDMRHKTGLRRMRNAVTLTDVRCSGADHGGCQAECQILWKDAWLKRLQPKQPGSVTRVVEHSPHERKDVTQNDAGDRTYVCQMTRLWEASEAMSPFDLRQDIRPLLFGNTGVTAYVVAILTRVFNYAQRLRGGAKYPFFPWSKNVGATPSSHIHFTIMDPVVIRSKEEIAPTLVDSRNKGLWFDPEMIRYCRQPAVVRRRVDRIIHESTGRMVVMKTPCLMLENVLATGEFLRLCPQHEYIFWREIWLKRAQAPKIV